ncbi:MAG: peptide deformylase [Deltaproteobacteria bacterium]|nr:peptide deformylase [Deltaproteobacteria bacterium]MBW1947226.1 peptide deformylase [Deltaproteobacteria bacterium]MBW1966880.1 peptide deformylase [Deltaproteobacteria bacterium]MBW2098261.1 peptide deformylase [Deltaproteobacteria bacterium]PXF54344.1 MAG: peptide deformylase [Deltaproteobacteria bacterium]
MKKILIYPHEILRQEAKSVNRIDGEFQGLIDQMLEIMYKAKGLGLAANQIGELKQLVVMDITPSERGPNPIVLINPRITEWEGEEAGEEGCLSVPNYSAPVKRAARVQLVGYDRNEKEIRLEAEGLLARCIQHELDHLKGICFVDRLSPARKLLFRKKWAKIRPKEE